MAVIVQDLPPITHEDEPGSGSPGSKDPRRSVLTSEKDRSPEPSRTGICVGLAAITMMFAAFSSAMIVTKGSDAAWKHVPLPPILYINTIVLLVSSATLEIARRRVAAFARGVRRTKSQPLAWLYATLALGLLFVAGQYAGWLRLRSNGLYLASNLSASFFYVLTAMHALHVLGGLAGLTRVIAKLSQPLFRLRKSTLDSTSYYWHFMGILWLYLLLILRMKL